ncbi:MAG: DNA primase, partial [Alphaproteobacteria bacterium]
VRALEAALPHATETRTVRFLFLPTEHDPDSFVRELGADAFERCVEGAVPLSRQLSTVAGEGCDLGTPEGRARMLKQAHPLWRLLPDGLLRRQLLGELARQGQMPESELQSLWLGEAAAAAAPPPPAPAERPRWQPKAEWKAGKGDWKSRRDRDAEPRPVGPRAVPPTPTDHAVRLLLLHSDLWEALSEEDRTLLHELPGEHGQLIHWLERHLTHHGASPWAAVQGGLAAEGLEGPAQRLLRSVQALGIEEHDAAGDLARAVAELRQRAPAALPATGATDEERRRALEALARLRERHGIQG